MIDFFQICKLNAESSIPTNHISSRLVLSNQRVLDVSGIPEWSEIGGGGERERDPVGFVVTRFQKRKFRFLVSVTA